MEEHNESVWYIRTVRIRTYTVRTNIVQFCSTVLHECRGDGDFCERCAALAPSEVECARRSDLGSHEIALDSVFRKGCGAYRRTVDEK